MSLSLTIIFLSCILLILHSYLFYPLHLLLLSRFKKSIRIEKETKVSPSSFLVSCIISVYNEEEIIKQKIQSVLDSDFPENNLQIFIGSDASSDDSDKIIQDMANNNGSIHFYKYTERRGKSFVINDLMEEVFKFNPRSENHILLFTDANVILSKDVISIFCERFQESDLALIDSRIIPTNLKSDGIAYSEDQYMSWEVKLKNMEGELWGAMMGAFGGCFAIRSNYLAKVPQRFLVDDFFISLSALSKGGKCKNDLNAVCYEGTSGQLTEEFRRKARISAGNFQNLAVFYKLLFRKPFSVAYAFFSHKVLRWIGPLLIILAWFSIASLAVLNSDKFAVYFIIFTAVLVLIPILDYFFSKIGIHIRILRGIRYFIMMNIALLFGLINYISGIRNSSWEPPKRTII